MSNITFGFIFKNLKANEQAIKIVQLIKGIERGDAVHLHAVLVAKVEELA